jgi:hypothetical protein
MTVRQIVNLLEGGSSRLPPITSITLIPNDDDDQAGTDGDDSDNDENQLEPCKSMDRFGPGILNAMAEIDFLDEEDEELPDVTEVGLFCSYFMFLKGDCLEIFCLLF